MPVNPSRYYLLALLALAASVAGGCQTASTSPSQASSPSQGDTAINPLIGHRPPPLTVAKWVKGEPLKTFEPGKVYVVDFWATWCGPCKAAIPHLSKLAQAHAGALEVIGISISERQKDVTDTSYIAAVDTFVKKMGDKMNYRVAVDTPDKQMHTRWFKPSGTGGIPTAWIIDQRGNVAWIGIGSPDDVERIAEAVLKGTFNIHAEAARSAAQEAEAANRSAADIAASQRGNDATDKQFPGYRAAMARGDQSAALASLDAAFASDPALETGPAYQWKLMLLMQRNREAEINAYARQLLTRFPRNDDIISFVSACLVSTGEEPRFDTALALELAKAAADMAKPGTRWAQFTKWRLGWAYYHTAKRTEAIDAMRSALEGIGALQPGVDFGDLESSCREALSLFEQPVK